MAHKSDSKLKSISTTRLNPQHHLWYAPHCLRYTSRGSSNRGVGWGVGGVSSKKMADVFNFNAFDAQSCKLNSVVVFICVWWRGVSRKGVEVLTLRSPGTSLDNYNQLFLDFIL